MWMGGLMFLMTNLCSSQSKFLVYWALMALFILALSLPFAPLMTSLGVWTPLSLSLILLSVWLMMVTSLAQPKKAKTFYYLSVGLIGICLYLTFTLDNLLMFYVAFEASLLPTLCLILGWGYQPERLQAVILMVIYCLLGSLPFLSSLFFYYWETKGLSFLVYNNSLASSLVLHLTAVMFLVKLPIFSLHLWLLKAHVEAPVGGSMILAGVLLKLGGYGLYMTFMLFKSKIPEISSEMMTLSLWSATLASLTCVFHSDLKAFIALSSVSHMALVIAVLSSLSSVGAQSAFLIMVGHGACSPALFLAADKTYLRSKSRKIYFNKGLHHWAPLLSFLWLGLAASNMSVPPSLSLAGEIMAILSLGGWVSSVLPYLFFYLFNTGLYSIFLFKTISTGTPSAPLLTTSESTKEILHLSLFWLPLNTSVFFLCM